MVIAGSGHNIHFYDIKSGMIIKNIKTTNTINDILLYEDKIVTASKGIQIYDLRNFNLIEEKEKNQVVVNLKEYNDIIYMGLKNKYIKPFNYKAFKLHSPLEPPHYDDI